jgi:succinoglycan biosynthesis transport protein ExoP
VRRRTRATLNEPTTDLRAYVRPIVDRWWLILVIVAFATAAAYVHDSSSAESTSYKSTTTLLVRNSPLESALLGDQTNQVDPEELVVLIQSRGTTSAVRRKLGDQKISGGVSAQVVKPEQATSTVSSLITLTATADSPRAAARLANTYATTFTELTSARTRRQVTSARERNERELAALGQSRADQLRRTQLSREIRRLAGIEALPAASVQQIDPAVNGSAVSHSPRREALFAFAVSLALAIGLAYLLALLDKRIRHVDQIEDRYGAPLLGAISHVKDPASAGEGQIAVPPSLRDAFRRIRVNLDLADEGRRLRTILVTSALPREGRSTLVRNLALAYREAGRRAAVIEADLRDPRLAELFVLSAGPGLTDVVRGNQPLREVLQEVGTGQQAVLAEQAGNGMGGPVESRGSVAVLTGGGPAQDATDVVSAETIRPLLDEAAERHDVVIVDSPPLLPLSDSVQLLSAVDGVLLVARIGHTTTESVDEVREILGRLSGVTVLGVVANDVSARGRLRRSVG